MVRTIAWLPLLGSLMACEAQPPEGAATEPSSEVRTSGKSAVPLNQVPAEVLAAAISEQPGFTASEAESETRDGRRYFDIGGRLADGSEIEFDILEEAERWRVVESQRDIAASALPASVQQASAAHDATMVPTRVIESRQQDGLVVYELFAPAKGDPRGRKLEITWDGKNAKVLAQEWAH